MAHKDPNVLNRINTLNTNLENTEIAKVEENIGKMLFNVLEGSSSISVDSELYASINNVANSSDIAKRIGDIKFDVAIPVNGKIIVNTGSLAHGDAIETQNSINKITKSENELKSLEENIPNLRKRFKENVKKLTDIADDQNVFGGGARGLDQINNDMKGQDKIKGRINAIIKILSKIITELNKVGGGDAGVLAKYKNDFIAADKAGIPVGYHAIGDVDVAHLGDIMTKLGDYTDLLNTTNDKINRLDNEKNLRNHIDGLNENKTPIHIQNGFLPFGDAETVASQGANEGLTRGFIDDFNNRITQLNNFEVEIPNIRARYTEHKNRLNKILQLQKLQENLDNMHSGLMPIRQKEIDAIKRICHNHLGLGKYEPTMCGPRTAYKPTLPNTTEKIGRPGPVRIINLNFVDPLHPIPVATMTQKYTLCDDSGNPLKLNGGNWEIVQGGRTISLKGITFDNLAQTMSISNLQVSPIEGLTFPLNLDLNVRVRIHDNGTGLDVDHHKPIHLEITAPTLPKSSLNPLDPSREHAYDSLVPPMNNRIRDEYTDRYREELENEAIWKILREGGNEAEVNGIYNNETRRNMFIDRLRTRLRGHFPFLPLADLQTGFRDDMTKEDRDVPVQYLLNQNDFQNYIRQNIPNNLRKYASGQINNNAKNAYRDDILQEFLDFQTDVANNPKDNSDNFRILTNNIIPNDNEGPRSLPDNPNRWQRLTRRAGKSSRRNNYTKFFQGRSTNLENLSLETEDGEIKYGVKVECTGVNKITATINIDGKKEPEIMEAANHDRLITGILSRAYTKDGEPLNRKLRCNIALSVLKAMVMIAPQKLCREIPPTNFTDAKGNPVICDRIEAEVNGGNLRIRGVRVDGTRVRTNVPIFDENQFKNLHDIHTLENGIRALSLQVNSIMNATAEEYQGAIDNLEDNRGLLKYDTAQRLRGGPIKRLRGRMVYGKTNNNFDFDTSVNEAGKSVNITFKGGKFSVSGEFDGEEYNFEAKDLGSILRKKINRKRVFDGIELAMVATINEQYVERLRSNNLIQTENFAVADLNNDKTGKVYIFDEAGNLSYLEIEDRALNPLGGSNAGRIDPDDIPVERIRCNEQERKEFMQNPLLAGRLMREMRRRLAF